MGTSADTGQILTGIDGSTGSSGITAGTQINARKRNRTVAIASRLSHLGGYDEAPANLNAWVTTSAMTLMTYSSEEGRRTADYNIKRTALADVKSSDIGLAAVDEPDDGEPRDCDFMAFSDIIFFEFLGQPGSLAYIKCLGHLDCNVKSLELSNHRFKLVSPTHFLIATGDFLTVADQMKAEELGQKGAKVTEPWEKRESQRAQEAAGERTEGGEKGVYYITTRDGRRLPIKDKTNLQTRCDHLEFMWRAAEVGLWKYIAGSGYKLQPETYWKILLEEAEALQQPVGSVFLRASKISLISGTTIAKDTKSLALFLRGDFGEEGLTLESFCVGAKLSSLAQPCIQQNAPLVGALEALGVALEVLFSFQFAGVCDVLIEALRGHLRPLRLTDSGFLVHSIDRVLVKFFRTVSKDDKALEFPECDITEPTGCATLLKNMLSAMILNLTDVVKVTILERRYTLLMRLRKERLVAAPAPPVKAKLKLSSPQAQGRERGDVDQCGSHLGQLLKAVKKNGNPLTCVKGADCRYKHGKLGELTRASATQLVATMPGWLQECLTPLVASCKAFKV